VPKVLVAMVVSTIVLALTGGVALHRVQQRADAHNRALVTRINIRTAQMRREVCAAVKTLPAGTCGTPVITQRGKP
jgi:hypothetical protein